MHLIKLIIMIALPISIGVLGQILLKMGTIQLGSISLISNSIGHYLRIFLNPFIFSGLSAYFISAVFWIYLLSRVPLSFAYPMLSTSYIIITIFSIFIFKEQVSLINWLGIFIIIIGVIFVTHGKV